MGYFGSGAPAEISSVVATGATMVAAVRWARSRGAIRLEPRRADLADLVTTAVEEWRHLLAHRRQQLSIELPQEAVWLDRKVLLLYQRNDGGLPADWLMYIEHRLFEPAFYATVIHDWGSSLMAAQAVGPKAFCLVDLGHHAPNVNIEMIVARLIQFGKLAGFHFNDSKYGDDDLDAGSIKPFQVFLIFNELVSNAYKHAFTGRTGKVAVTLAHAGTGALVLRVSDDGAGLPLLSTARRPWICSVKLRTILSPRVAAVCQSNSRGKPTPSSLTRNIKPPLPAWARVTSTLPVRPVNACL
jgi:signal transduction histidine kinase